jgi:hypothetical protein
MNRALWIGTFLTIACVAVATGSGLYLLGNTEQDEKKSPPAGEVAKADEQAGKDGASAPTSEVPKANENSKGSEGAKAAEEHKPAAAPTKGEAAKDALERRQLLEILGALTAAHGYQTYLNIGFIADGKAKGIYSEKDAYKLLDSVLALVSSVDRKLAALDKIDLDKEDHASLEQMRQLSSLLRKQAKELQVFWDTGKDEDAAQYESVRKDSWTALSKLIGISR